MTPTARTLHLLRDLGAEHVERTETWNPFSRTRHDFFGFADIVCCLANELIAVQTTTFDNLSARRKKINSLDAAKYWYRCGGKIWIIVWGKAEKNNRQGLPAGRWYHKVESVKF